MEIYQLSVEIEIILDVTANSGGIIDPHLIHLTILTDKFRKIKTILTPNSDFPIEISVNNYFEIITFSKISIQLSIALINV